MSSSGNREMGVSESKMKGKEETEMSMAERDIKKYERAIERAKAVGLTEYIAPFRRAIDALREVADLDEEYSHGFIPGKGE